MLENIILKKYPSDGNLIAYLVEVRCHILHFASKFFFSCMSVGKQFVVHVIQAYASMTRPSTLSISRRVFAIVVEVLVVELQ